GIPTQNANVEGELVTPTGAAIMRANAQEFVQWPSMKTVCSGYGAGTRTLPDRPNLLRVVLGDEIAAVPVSDRDDFVVLEANVDDASGELVAYVTDALLREGALDAWTVPIGMKKSRPAVMICALCRSSDATRLGRVVLAESSTLGVRVRKCQRI